MALGECKATGKQIARLSRSFTDLHEGLPPDEITCGFYRPLVGPVTKFGRITEIQYQKVVKDDWYDYWHPFETQASPSVGLDRLSQLVIYSGRYHVTTRGIEDLPASKVRSERVPSAPKSLTVLGNLQWIKYTWSDSGVHRVGKLTFSGRTPPTLAHDETGNLHVLNSRVRTEVKNMARRKHPKKSRKHARRHNPVELTGKALTRVFYPAALLGAGIAVVSMASDKFLSGPKDVNDLSKGPKFTPYQKAMLEAGLGLALGAGASVLKAPAELTLAIAAGGVAKGALDAAAEYQFRQDPDKVAKEAAAASSALTARAVELKAKTNSGAYALNPGGLPQGYQAVGPARAYAVNQ